MEKILLIGILVYVILVLIVLWITSEKFEPNIWSIPTPMSSPPTTNVPNTGVLTFTIPQPARDGFAIQNNTLGELSSNPQNATNILNQLRNQEQTYGLIATDNFGACTGVWLMDPSVPGSWVLYSTSSYTENGV